MSTSMQNPRSFEPVAMGVKPLGTRIEGPRTPSVFSEGDLKPDDRIETFRRTVRSTGRRRTFPPILRKPRSRSISQSGKKPVAPSDRRRRNYVDPTRRVVLTALPYLSAVLTGLFLLATGSLDALILWSGPVSVEIFPDELEPNVPVLKASLESPVVPDAVSRAVFTQHRVVRGETLSRIAYRYGLSPATLISVNRLDHPDQLRSGHELIVPYRDGIRVEARRNDTVDSVAKQYDVDPESIQVFPESGDFFIPDEGAHPQAPFAVTRDVFLFPVAGRILTGFDGGVDDLTGIPFESEGIELSSDNGTPVRASRSGTVQYTGHHPVYGLYVMMSHAGGWKSFYGHLGRVDVAPGDELGVTDILGTVGSSGNARSSRLYFGLMKDGESVDPLDYLY